MKTKFISLLLAVTIILSGCANYYLKKGAKAYDNFQFQSAIKNLQKGLAKKNDYMSEVRLARSYRMTSDTKNALIWYGKIVTNDRKFSEDLFNYARMLMSNSEYKKAAKIFAEYLTLVKEDRVAEMLMASCNSIDEFYKDTLYYSVKPAGIVDDNGMLVSQFGAAKLENGIVFTGERNEFRGKKINPWTGKSYLDLYYTQKTSSGKWLNPVLLKGDVNGQFHEGPAVFTKDGSVVYFTRSNYTKKKLKKDGDNVSNLKIFRAELVDGNWVNITDLPFNSDEFSCGHPTLSEDESMLYFVSDMPGSVGGTDLYRVLIGGKDKKMNKQEDVSSITNNHSGGGPENKYEISNKEKGWGMPENLGDSINTQANEMFPYMHHDGKLFFSSEAHNNMGGLDVFVTSMVNGKWTTPANLNYPINSPKDDFAFVMNNDDSTGYLSTNRSGVDNINEFRKNGPTLNLIAISRVKETNVPLIGVNVRIIDLSKNVDVTILSGNDGRALTKLPGEGEYLIKFEKENYLPYSEKLSVKDQPTSKDYTVYYYGNELIVDKPIVLDNIYYDYNKWFIREDAEFPLNNVVEMLQKYPNMIIEMSSHTDSRGKDKYNMTLSDKRAHAAVDYLISKGIDKSRLKWKGYGESMLLNQCSNGVECTADEHQKNRRTEFKILKK